MTPADLAAIRARVAEAEPLDTWVMSDWDTERPASDPMPQLRRGALRQMLGERRMGSYGEGDWEHPQRQGRLRAHVEALEGTLRDMLPLATRIVHTAEGWASAEGRELAELVRAALAGGK